MHHDAQAGIQKPGLNSLLWQRPDSWSRTEIADRCFNTDGSRLAGRGGGVKKIPNGMKSPARCRIAAGGNHRAGPHFLTTSIYRCRSFRRDSYFAVFSASYAGLYGTSVSERIGSIIASANKGAAESSARISLDPFPSVIFHHGVFTGCKTV